MASYNFSHIKGDTYDGARFTVTVNGTLLDLTGAHILCQFRKDSDSDPILTWTDGAGITIISAGVFEFDAQIIDIPVDQYEFDVQITTFVGVVKTYIRGILTITKESSHG